MIDPSAFQSVFTDCPWLMIVGPLVGFFLAYLKDSNHLQGFSLLVVALLVSAIAIGAYGLYDNWTFAEWHKAPFGILVTVALSNLTATTALHVKDAVTNSQDS